MLKVRDPLISLICFCSMTASLINLSEGCSCLKLFEEVRRICAFERLTNAPFLNCVNFILQLSFCALLSLMTHRVSIKLSSVFQANLLNVAKKK